MNIIQALKLDYYAYRFKLLLFYLGIVFVPAIFIGLFNDRANIDFYIYASIFIMFLLFTLAIAIYNNHKVSKCYLSTTANRHAFYLGSLITMVVVSLLNTLVFILCVSLVKNYFLSNNIALSNFDYLNFKSLMCFFTFNLLAFSLGSIISLLFKKCFIVIIAIIVILMIVVIVKNINIFTFIESFLNNIINNNFSSSLLVSLGGTVVINGINFFLYR